MEAAAKGRLGTVKALLDCSADVAAKDKEFVSVVYDD
jgi:hypothetical protein